MEPLTPKRETLWTRLMRSWRTYVGHVGIGEERNYFVDNLALLLASGINVGTAIKSIQSEVRSKSMQKIITRLEENINEGLPLSQALEQTNLLSAQSIALLKIGEKSGYLTQNLKIIAAQQERSRMFRSKLRSAMLYPVFVFSLTIISSLLISWYVLPRLAVVFIQLRVPLPFFTRLLVAIGSFLATYGFVAVPLFIVVFLVMLYFLFIFEDTRFIGQGILFSLPGIKKLIQEVEIAHMGYTLGTLLTAGLPIVEGIHTLPDSATFYIYKELYRHLEEHIDAGDSFEKSLRMYPKSTKLIPAPIQQLIISGEQSGQLPQVLLRIGDVFEEKMETTTKNLTTILEPILLIVVWLEVLLFALAVITPIYTLIGRIH